MVNMTLKMAAATGIYIAATILLWYFWNKSSEHTRGRKIAVGVFYGLCSVLSSHIGIDYGNWVLNVRDLGPLAAGLFFDPLAGILAGLIGGIERFVIGEYFGIGSYTRVACGLSTVLAGLLAALLHRWVYNRNKPRAIPSLFLGAEMEVFHMYAVLFTHPNDIDRAYEVVDTCALPMAAFTGMGLAICSVVITRVVQGKQRIHPFLPKGQTLIQTRVERWLFAVVFLIFASSMLVNYNLETRMADQEVADEMQFRIEDARSSFRSHGDIRIITQELDSENQRMDTSAMLVDTEKMHQYTSAESGERPGPVNPELVKLIHSHSEGEIFEARIGEGEGEKWRCLAGVLEEPYSLLIRIPEDDVYYNRGIRLMEEFFLEILICTLLYLLVIVLVDRLVVRNLDRVNDSLRTITAGNLTETVDVQESVEFSALSEDINKTVTALRGFIDAAEKRMKDDLKLAATIQDSALPKNFRLPTENLEIHALMTPAKQVGGDFYDFFYIAPDQLVLVIADVSGKGIPASLFMMRSKTAIKNFARSGMNPAELLEAVNNVLCEGNEAEMFVTVWLGILDLKTGKMRCSNGGHEYPVLMRAGEAYELLRDKHNMVLGSYEGIPRTEYEIQMEPGDRLFVYTDGVPEAINEAAEPYGSERMLEQLNRTRDLSQKETLDGMLKDLRRFAGKAEQFDDITMLGITYLRPGEKT